MNFLCFIDVLHLSNRPLPAVLIPKTFVKGGKWFQVKFQGNLKARINHSLTKRDVERPGEQLRQLTYTSTGSLQNLSLVEGLFVQK